MLVWAFAQVVKRLNGIAVGITPISSFKQKNGYVENQLHNLINDITGEFEIFPDSLKICIL